MKNELKQIFNGNETFTMVYKELFSLKLKPLELLVLSRVIEWYNNDKICYETSKSLGDDFGVSANTINSAIDKLEERNLIIKDTKRIQSGQERKITLNLSGLKEALAKSTKQKKVSMKQQKSAPSSSTTEQNFMTITKSTEPKIVSMKQQKDTNTPTTEQNFMTAQNQNLLLHRTKNCYIKDNIKDNIKDKESSSLSPITINQEDFIQQGLAPTMIVHEEDNEGNKIVESCGKTYKIIPLKQTSTAQEQIAALGF